MLIPMDDFSMNDRIIEEAKAVGCFYCHNPILDEQFPIVFWHSGEVSIYLHDGCAQGLGVHLIKDGYRTHDENALHVHGNGTDPAACFTCRAQSNLQAVGERRPGRPSAPLRDPG